MRQVDGLQEAAVLSNRVHTQYVRVVFVCAMRYVLRESPVDHVRVLLELGFQLENDAFPVRPLFNAYYGVEVVIISSFVVSEEVVALRGVHSTEVHGWVDRRVRIRVSLV